MPTLAVFQLYHGMITISKKGNECTLT